MSDATQPEYTPPSGVVFQRLSKQLIESAETLLTQGHYGPAVVIAQTACEVATELFISYALVKKDSEYLLDYFESQLRTFSLQNQGVRGLYIALIGDVDVAKKSFWEPHTKAAKLRHQVVHQGLPMTQDNADFAIKASTGFLDYLQRVADKL